MSALKRFLSGHKQRKAHSLPNLTLSEGGKRASGDPISPLSPSLDSAAQVSPFSTSPVSTPLSSAPNSRSGSRVRHRKTDSVDIQERKAQEKRDYEVKRKYNYDNVRCYCQELPSPTDHNVQDPLNTNYGELPLNMSQEGLGTS